VRLVFAGTPEVALPSLDALVASRHQVLAVITRPDAPRGRGRSLEPSSFAHRAAELAIPALKPRRPSDEDFVTALKQLDPDCCPVVAYGALIPQHVLDIPRHGWVNLHFSLLPAWRGAAPVQHAIMAGDDITGATTFQLVADLDAGPVYGNVTEPIGPRDTAGDLLLRLSQSGARLLVETLDGIEAGTLCPRPQEAGGISLAPKITVEDARIDWTKPARDIDRRIRGCHPAPGAWTTFRGERLKIGPAQITDDQGLAPGALAVSKRAVCVGTGTTALELGEVQAQGKKAMPASDWARGINLDGSETLGR
jgi:methionyl-tRNA formyltransferase